MSCKSNHIWTGDSYASTTEGSDVYILRLGSGRSICDIIHSNQTAVPDHIQLYEGSDPDVPAAIRCSDRDLVIHCNDAAQIHNVSVCYFDAVVRAWRGPYSPEVSFWDESRTWFVFKRYLDVVIPFRSEVRMQMSGSIEPIEPDDSDYEIPAATALQIIQPPEEFNLALELTIFNNEEMTDVNVNISTEHPNPEFPVTIFNGTAFVDYPVAGVDKKTAGQYVVVSLKNLDYSDRVYIKWIWRGVSDRSVAGFGATTYPAYTATNPDNIGFVWETNM